MTSSPSSQTTLEAAVMAAREELIRQMGLDAFVDADLSVRAVVVAALKVLRKPTDAMCDAGSWGPMTAPDRVWQRMINALIGELA